MISVGILTFLIWVYLLLLHGDFWRTAEPAELPPVGQETLTVVAVIPARNEAEGISATISSLLTQRFAGRFQLVLVNDHSEDDTVARARAAARALGAADRLQILEARDLPPGWTGKLWAISEGLDQAAALEPDFILLTDADIEHDPDNLAQLVARATRDRYDLTSLMVRLHCGTLPERAFIPAFVFFFFMLYPPAWAADPTRRLAAAAGGCMLVRASALRRIGGIAGIRNALIDDCALAAAIKASGGRIWLDVTRRTKSSRIYRNVGEIWAMIARTAFTQLRYSPLLLAATLAGLAITYLAPPALALFGHGDARCLGLLSWIAMALAFVPTLKLYDRPFLWGFALPLIAIFYGAATVGSALRYWRGAGGEWKGRSQIIR